MIFKGLNIRLLNVSVFLESAQSGLPVYSLNITKYYCVFNKHAVLTQS